MITNSLESFLPALEMIDSTLPEAPAVDAALKEQVLTQLRLSQANTGSREDLASHVLNQAYQSVGFGPALSVLKQYAS